MADDVDAEEPNIHHFLDSRRAGRPSGINMNYVFKAPRMRKRVGKSSTPTLYMKERKKVSPQVTDCKL